MRGSSIPSWNSGAVIPMTNYEISTMGIRCPFCEFVTPIPSAMIWYEWKGNSTQSGKETWYCVKCGEKLNVKVKRHIFDAEVTND